MDELLNVEPSRGYKPLNLGLKFAYIGGRDGVTLADEQGTSPSHAGYSGYSYGILRFHDILPIMLQSISSMISKPDSNP